MIDFSNEFNALSLNEIITICELQEHLFSLTEQSLISTANYVANSMFSETRERVSQLSGNILNCMKINPSLIPLYTFFFKELMARKSQHNSFNLISAIISNPFPSINSVSLPRYAFLNECIQFEILQEQDIVKSIRRYFDFYSHSLLPWKYAFAWFAPSIYQLDPELYNLMLQALKDDLKQTEIQKELKDKPSEQQNSFITFFNNVFAIDTSSKSEKNSKETTLIETQKDESPQKEKTEEEKIQELKENSSYYELSAFVKILPELQNNDWEMHKIVMSTLYYPETIEFFIREDRVAGLINLINQYEDEQRKEIDRIIKENENEYEYDYEYVDDETADPALVEQSAPVIKPKKKKIFKIEDTGDDVDADENTDDYSSSTSTSSFSSSSVMNEKSSFEDYENNLHKDYSIHFGESRIPRYDLKQDDDFDNQNTHSVLNQTPSHEKSENDQEHEIIETTNENIQVKTKNEKSLPTEQNSDIKFHNLNCVGNNDSEIIKVNSQQNNIKDKEIANRIISQNDQLPVAESTPVFKEIDKPNLHVNQNSALIELPKKRKKIKINRRPSLHKTVPTFQPFNVNQRIHPSVFEKNEFLRHWPTLVQFAAFHGAARCLTELINRGADLSLTDYSGKKIAMFAIANGNLDIIEYLEYHNIDFSGTLQVAALFNKQDAFLRLVQTERFKLNDIDPEFGSVLHQAAAANNIRTMIYCIERGIDVNIRDNKDATPLYNAVENRQLDATLFLSDHKQIDPNAKNKDGITPLMMACKMNFINGAKAILGIKNVNINEVDKFNSTALHYAVMANAIRIVSELSSYEGIDFSIKDANKQTALDLAYTNGFEKCAQIIKDKQKSCNIY